MIASNTRNTLGFFVGVAGAAYVGFACFGIAFTSRSGQGWERFTPWLLLLAAVAFVASTLVVRHRVALLLVICLAYAPFPVFFIVPSRATLFLHLFAGLAAIAGIGGGALLHRYLSSRTSEKVSGKKS